jgi:hypothetical protein
MSYTKTILKKEEACGILREEAEGTEKVEEVKMQRLIVQENQEKLLRFVEIVNQMQLYGS